MLRARTISVCVAAVSLLREVNPLLSVTQAIKHKLHMKSVVAVSDHASTSDVEQEEDKAKLLLGAKLQVGSRVGETTRRVWQSGVKLQVGCSGVV